MDDFPVHEYRSDIGNEPQQFREINRNLSPSSWDDEWDEIVFKPQKQIINQGE